MHVVVPDHDDRSELAEAVDDFARADFADALHDEDAGEHRGRARRPGRERELAHSVAALKAAGVAQVDGEVATGHPVDAVVALARALDADEVVVLTEPHLLADWTRRDWATRLRHALDLPGAAHRAGHRPGRQLTRRRASRRLRPAGDSARSDRQPRP